MFLLENPKIKNIDHLGIVAGLIDEIGIVELIDEKLGIDHREKISTGKVVKAMILNSLGMVSRPLYLFPQFFEDKAVEKLLGEGIKAEYLNDDKLGRVMDEIYKYGLTNLFVDIVLKVINKFNIETSFSHLDATSFHLHGEYKGQETDDKDEEIIKSRPILIKKGYSRDHRFDLKQCILDLIVSNDNAIPLFMRAGDGNETDVEVFGKIFVEFKKRLKLDSIMVADCALYSQNNLKIMGDLKWITRVPLKLSMAKKIIEKSDILSIKINEKMTEKQKELTKELQEKGYKWIEERVVYQGVKQRWLIVESEARKKSDLEKLETKINQEEATIKKKLKKLEQEEFENESQARYQLNLINKKSNFFRLKIIYITEILKKSKAKVYKLQLETEKKTEVIERKMIEQWTLYFRD